MEKNLDMLKSVTFVNDNIINFYAKHLITNCPCPETFLYLESQVITMFERAGHLNGQNLGLEGKNIIFVPINVFYTNWQVMVIVNASDEVKETEVLFFDSKLGGFDPRKNDHFHCDTGQATQDFEIDFLKIYLVAILTQERF